MNCEICKKPLVAIGNKRKNGANHKDWDTRKMHKQCYKTQLWKCNDEIPNEILKEFIELNKKLFKE
jgi:hypothetical protein